MNKVSGKLAAGVRKVKTRQKPAVAVEKTAPVPTESKRATTAPKAASSAMHPARIWPD